MADAPARLIAALADRYRIERELGAGGMATVYLAHDLKHDRQVAIKVLRPELAAVIGAERFLAEIRTTANLQHPHILPLFDSGEADGFLFYVMPYVDGETLRERLARETQLPVAEAVQFATEIAGALDYAHRRGVVHRDIKPENVMLHDGRALVADFGIALAMANTNAGRMTETGMSLGTPHYMSPEQAMGEREIGPRSDVYALGCVLYEMLAGEPPFTGPSAQAIVARVLSEEPRPLATQRKTVPPGVEDAVRTALEKLPADRFASAADFAAALADGRATRVGAHVHHDKGHHRAGSARLVGALAGIAAVCALLAAWGWLRETDGIDRASAVAFTIERSGPLGIVTPEVSDVVPVAISPDGKTLAYVVQPDGIPMLAVRAIDRPEATILPGTEEVDGAMTFSPDGKSLAFLQRRKIRRIALDGTPPVDVADVTRSSSGSSINWRAGDTLYYTAEGTRGFYRVSAGGAEAPVVIPLPDSIASYGGVREVPGTDWLLMTRLGSRDQAIIAYSTATGEFRDVAIDATGILPTADGRAVVLTKDNQAITIAPFDPQSLTLTGPEVVVIPSIGGNVAASGMSATLSASGTLAYLASTREDNRIVEVTRSGNERVLTTTAAGYKDPRWSPDGTRVATTIGGTVLGDLWMSDLRSGIVSRITNNKESDLYPVWMQSGREVLFATTRSGIVTTWRVPVDGSGEPEPLTIGVQTVNGHPQTITADGRTLIFRTESQATGADLFAAPLDGTGDIRPLFTAEGDQHAPAFSSDDRWLAYTSDESGTWEVYVTAWPGLGPRRQLSSGGGREPRWNPRGGELFYRAGDAMVSVQLQEQDGLPAAVRRDTLFSGPYRVEPRWPQYDVSRDGQRFLMVRQGVFRKPPVVVITNWLEGALEKMKNGSATP